MKYTINVGNIPIELQHDDFESVINVDDLTKIDTSNIFGEAVTADASANRIGLMQAELDSQLADLHLDRKILQGQIKEKLRAQASADKGLYTIIVGGKEAKVKLTEKALETCFETDEDWIELSRKIIKKERMFNDLKSLYWSAQNKSRKLNGNIPSTVPEEFINDILGKTFNGILIKKK